MRALYSRRWLHDRALEMQRLGILPLAQGGEPAQRGRTAPSPRLLVYLLGAGHVEVNDRVITSWSGARARSVFNYLVTHRNPWPRREVLMDVFWPRSAPAAARNSLNVAMHSIRRTLRTAADQPIVVVEGGSYRLHADVGLSLDADDFEYHVQTGHALRGLGDLAGAEVEYARAAALYQGDFAIDDPYADWVTFDRERLRLAYLDVLDWLSELYFDRRHYASSGTLCQRILERDPCWEGAHRRLMRCYVHLGHYHLAVLQYRRCEKVLRADVGVDPAPATKELFQRLRNHAL